MSSGRRAEPDAGVKFASFDKLTPPGSYEPKMGRLEIMAEPEPAKWRGRAHESLDFTWRHPHGIRLVYVSPRAPFMWA